jgi:hypothetical protein
MGQEKSRTESQGEELAMREEAFHERTYDKKVYTFQRTGAVERTDTFVGIDVIATAHDTEFYTQGALKQGMGGIVPAGPGPTSVLHFEVQARLGGEHVEAIARHLANFVFGVSDIEL